MNIMIRTQKIGSTFATNLAAALTEMGHNVLRSSKNNKTKRVVFAPDVEPLGKISQFNAFVQNKVSTVPHTVNKTEALSWVAEGDTVVCRTKTNAHSGEGIVIAETPDAVVEAPLYTKYVKKFSEFRVHVFNNKVIFIQQKKASKDALDAGTINYQIRNHQFGWNFTHLDLEVPSQPKLEEVAKKALRAVGYLFGAVDVIYNKRNDQYYVLEVNSRPGIEGTTATVYAQAVSEYLEQGTQPVATGAYAKITPCDAWIARCAEMGTEVTQIEEITSMDNFLRITAFAYKNGWRSPADAKLGTFYKSVETFRLNPDVAAELNSYLAGKVTV